MSTAQCPTYDVHRTVSNVRCPPHNVQRTMSTSDVQRTMSILAKTWGLSQRDGFRQPYSNFSNRPYPLAQNRGTILMGIAVWRVTDKTQNRDFRSEHRSARAEPSERPERSERSWIPGTTFPANTAWGRSCSSIDGIQQHSVVCNMENARVCIEAKLQKIAGLELLV